MYCANAPSTLTFTKSFHALLDVPVFSEYVILSLLLTMSFEIRVLSIVYKMWHFQRMFITAWAVLKMKLLNTDLDRIRSTVQ